MTETTTAAAAIADSFPLTDMQVAYLVGQHRLIDLGGRQNYYIELDAVGLDPRRAEEALNVLVRRQEHLRTVMFEQGVQRVVPAAQTPRLRIPVADLSDATPAQRHAATARTRDRMCEQGGLDPTEWPLFEVAISKLRAHRCRLHVRMNLVLLDGPSLRRCLVEFLALYENPDAVLPPIGRTFRDWRRDLAEHEQSEDFAAQLTYWRDRLDRLPAAPRLPLARPTSSIEKVSFTGRRSFLTRRQWANFGANYRRHRVLPTTALLHAYAEILGAWADSPHFCLNVVHQNLAAKHPGSQDVVGQRSATLPLEVDLRDGDFWERARRLQRQLFRDMANADVTAVRIGREMAARDGWTQRAAFPYVFTSNQGPGWDTATVTRPAFRLLDRIQHTPQVLVDNQIRDAPDGGVSSMLDFVEEAFPTGMPDLLVAAYRRLLDVLGAPDGDTARPDLVAPEHRAIVAARNDTAAPAPTGRLEDGFLDQAARRPDATAVRTDGQAVSYGELDRRSRAVARWLGAQGVGAGDLVPVVMHKGVEQVVAVLAVLRAGAAYCPIDAATPTRRLRHLLAECDARVVLAQSAHRPDAGADLAVLDVDRVAPSDEPLAPAPGDGTDLAYVVYTSGSTGRPKGVMIEHRSALNTVLDLDRRIGLGVDDRVFGLSALSFDLSVWDVFGTLTAGATLVLPGATARPDPVGWAECAARHGVTVWNSVPALAEMLVEVLDQRPESAAAPIRAFLLSGDWIAVPLPDRIRRWFAGARIVAMGGATEASIWSNQFEVDHVDPAWHSIPYGGPLTNQTMYVLDHRLDVRPPWAVGEIHIGGVGLARGYRNDPDRTAERFVRHPGTGERLYRTGDLGRYWPDGTIEFLGRADRQVKVQGFRVEPGEVEAALRDHDGVQDCVVCADDAPGGQRRLVAVVVPAPAPASTPADLIAHLRGRLPHYLVPSAVHLTGALPLTANGKVDTAALLAALAAPAPAGPPPADSPVARRLAALWAELLDVPAVGGDDDFFALGGNSLQALRMISRVRTEWGIDVPLGQVFEAPTVRQFANRITSGAQPDACSVELSATGTARPLVLFHVVGGSIARYAPLADAWPGPVRAFQSRALLDAAAPLPPDLETMAAGYVAELRTHQPTGPYLLGGWSSGGLLAYEAARQLSARGERTAVFMVDTVLAGTRPPSDDLDRQLGFLLGLAQGAPPAAVTAAVRAAEPDRRTAAARDACVAHGLLPAEVDVDRYRWLMRLQEHELALTGAYRPTAITGPVLLYLAADETDRVDPLPAWHAACSGLTHRIVPGDHFTVADQFARLAGDVGRWLDRAPG